MIMVSYHGSPRPSQFEPYAMSFAPLKQVIWSIVGAGGCTDKECDEINELVSLAGNYPNTTGAIMDDFFRNPATSDEAAVFTARNTEEIRRRLHDSGNLDLWVVLYDYQLSLNVHDHLNACDGITFWTWKAADLQNLERNFERLEKLTDGKARLMLGCYMFDYGTSSMMSVDLMKKQCDFGLKLLEEHRIEGMVFLASCICDMKLDAVEWTRQWIAQVGDEAL